MRRTGPEGPSSRRFGEIHVSERPVAYRSQQTPGGCGIRQYEDFDLTIEPAGDGSYRTRILNSPSGQAEGAFDLPFNDLEFENFLLKIGRHRGGVRRLESPETEAAREFGSKLFDAVFAEEIGTQFRRSLDAVERDEAGLRIRLRLSDAPELNDVPWEFLHSRSADQFVVLSSWTPLVRYINLDRGADPLTVAPPLRILAMVSSPTDYPPLDVDAEWARLDESLAEMVAAGLVEVTRLEQPTLRELQRALRQPGDHHIFHFIGHGGFDERAEDGLLLLENDMGRAREVSGRALGTILGDARTIRLAVLNSCEGARTSAHDPLGGAAQSLVHAGIDAVVAMQFEISDRAAIVFAHEFYAALADAFPVDAALAEARRAIFGTSPEVEWGTPVLHMRSGDGRLFDMVGDPTPRTVDAEPDDAEPDDADPDDTEPEAAEPEAAEPDDAKPQAVVDVTPEVSADIVPSAELDDAAAIPEAAAPDVAQPSAAPAEAEPAATTPDGVDPVYGTSEDLSPAADIDLAETGREAAVRDEQERGIDAPAQAPIRPPVPRRRSMTTGAKVGIGAGVLVAAFVGAQFIGGDDPVPDAGDVAVTPTTVVATTVPEAATMEEAAPPDVVDTIDSPTVASVPLPGRITVDGDLSEWDFVTAEYLLQHVICCETAEPLGTASSATLRVAHDDSALYIAALVDDDAFRQNNVGNQIWRGDAVTLNVSTGEVAAEVTPGDIQLTMTPRTLDGNPGVVRFTAGDRGRFGPDTIDEPVEVAGWINGDGSWTLEAVIPWFVIGLDGPPQSPVVALFAVFDNDGETESDGDPAQTFISANAPTALFQTPNSWGLLTVSP